jgi:hypothetical protein
MQEKNLKRNTCDICGDKEILKEKEPSKFSTIKIPLPYYNEYGSNTNQESLCEVDLCPACQTEFMKNILKHYDAANIAYAGVQIKRREENND